MAKISWMVYILSYLPAVDTRNILHTFVSSCTTKSFLICRVNLVMAKIFREFKAEEVVVLSDVAPEVVPEAEVDHVLEPRFQDQ